MRVPFAKYHSAGNDFILIDDRLSFFPFFSPGLISKLCKRCTGIGADGLILLQSSLVADFKMRIFNADGSEPAMCGNGLRCLFDFIKELGWEENLCKVETKAGILTCFSKSDQIGVCLGHPKSFVDVAQVKIDDFCWDVHLIDTSVPHGVVIVEDLFSFAFLEVAKTIREHPLFSPEGINVNFAQKISENSWLVRTYERGVEGETISCSTGAAAVGYVLQKRALASQEIEVLNVKKVDSLRVESCPTQGIFVWGSVCLVFEGSLCI